MWWGWGWGNADTPKFEAMVKESERAYAAGEWEEGGWNA